MLAKKLNSIQINRNIFIETHSQNMHVVISMHVYKHSKITTKSAWKEREKTVAIYHRCATKHTWTRIHPYQWTDSLSRPSSRTGRPWLSSTGSSRTHRWGWTWPLCRTPRLHWASEFCPVERDPPFGVWPCGLPEDQSNCMFTLLPVSYVPRRSYVIARWCKLFLYTVYAWITFTDFLTSFLTWVLPPNHTI